MHKILDVKLTPAETAVLTSMDALYQEIVSTADGEHAEVKAQRRRYEQEHRLKNIRKWTNSLDLLNEPEVDEIAWLAVEDAIRRRKEGKVEDERFTGYCLVLFGMQLAKTLERKKKAHSKE